MAQQARTALSWLWTILIFSLLGLATSLAIAWGAAIHRVATNPLKIAGVRSVTTFGVRVYCGVTRTDQGRIFWRLPDEGSAPPWSLLHEPPLLKDMRVTTCQRRVANGRPCL